jgi:hypothetical protein
LRRFNPPQRFTQVDELKRPDARKITRDVRVPQLVAGVLLAEILRIVRDESEPDTRPYSGVHYIRVDLDQNRIVDAIPLPMESARLSMARCTARIFTASAISMISDPANSFSILPTVSTAAASPKVGSRWFTSSSS